MTQDGRQSSILVVDDRRQFWDVLAEVLTDAGDQIQCAGDGEVAWTEIQACLPDLVLSDITMPRRDGVSFALRLAEAGSRLPIILMSAGSKDAAVVSRPVVCKPFAMAVLLVCIARTLEEADPARTLAPRGSTVTIGLPLLQRG